VGLDTQGASLEGRRWQFGWCEFHELSRQLLVHGQPVRIEAKPADVLVLLLEGPSEVHSKDELIGAAWAHSRDGASDFSLTTAIRKLRSAFGGGRDEIILTVPHVGYRMAVSVSEILSTVQKPAEARFSEGDEIPGRPRWKVLRALDAARTVWLAEQEKTHEIRVFKFATDGVRLRALQREVTLSRLIQRSLSDRDGFVRILDWGFDDPPFFTESEYGGIDLVEWASTGNFRDLAVDQRIALAADLSEILAAAHSLGILHNDLKPANVLIQETMPGDSSAAVHPKWQIRVADFGVASMTRPERLREMQITQHGFSGEEPSSVAQVGTGMYLAPEVLAGGPPSTAADVYALGIILYQMVTGDFLEPLSPGWENRIDDALLREDIAAAAQIDPTKRIGTATDLAARLRTLESRRTELAARVAESKQREDDRKALERARVRRPWVVVTMAALVSGLVATLWFAHRANQERLQAQADAAHARRVEMFTESLFASGEDRVPEKQMTVETLLRRGVQQIRGLDNDRPEQSEMLQVIGDVYNSMGLFDESAELLTDALKEREEVFGPSSPQLATTLVQLSKLRDQQGQEEQALTLAERALAIDARSSSRNAPEILRDQIVIATAWIGLGRHRDAVPLLQAVIREEEKKPNHLEDLSNALGELTIADLYLGDNTAAGGLVKKEEAIDRARLGDRHPDVGADLIDESSIELAARSYPAAETAARGALKIYRDWFGPKHYEVASAETTLADALIYEGKTGEALPLLTDARQIQKGQFPAPNERTAHTLAALGHAELDLHHLDAALENFHEAEGQYRTLFPDGENRIGLMLFNEGKVYAAEKQFQRAQEKFEQSVAIEAAHLPATDRRLLDARLMLGETFVAEHLAERAELLLKQVYKDASASADRREEQDRAARALRDVEDHPKQSNPTSHSGLIYGERRF
jgi:serine/threonine protein kinase/DNA-binding winged helix-turn-helix (wHTH) protein